MPDEDEGRRTRDDELWFEVGFRLITYCTCRRAVCTLSCLRCLNASRALDEQQKASLNAAPTRRCGGTARRPRGLELERAGSGASWPGLLRDLWERLPQTR